MSDVRSFTFACPDCGHREELPLTSHGRSILCPGCSRPHTARVTPSTIAAAGATTTVRVRRRASGELAVGDATPIRPITTEIRRSGTKQIAKPATRPVAKPVDMAAIPAATRVQDPRKPIPSPLPGAVDVSSDRIEQGQLPEKPEFDPEHAGPTVEFRCTACSAHLLLPSHFAGRPIRCPRCNAVQRVGEGDVPEPMATTRSISKRMRTAGGQPAEVSTASRAPEAPVPKASPSPAPRTAPSTIDTDILGGADDPPPILPPPAVPVVPPVRHSMPLLIATGIFALTTIGFAAMSVYAVLALRETRARVVTLERRLEMNGLGSPPATASAAPVR